MEAKDSKFITQLVILTVVVMAASLALNKMLTVWWPAIAVFFAIISAVMYFLSEKAKKKEKNLNYY